MTRRLFFRHLGPLAVLLWVAGAAAQDVPPPPPVPPEGVEVMARGPVHEAYAEPTDVRPQPSPLVAKQPPGRVNELPPDQRPQGENVQWIPGYWSWDQDRSDYLWVSGFWRVPPPGRQWVPGTWQPVEGGWHWVPGFWAPAGQPQLQYLPAPPPTLDEGPSVPAPQATSSYVPGCWVYRQTRYFWRPGFWSAFHPGWVWIPAHYVWTPGGYLFVEGYWDHPLEARGLLFAPVRLAARLLGRPRWSYTPQYVIQPDFLLGALFVRPALGHYYFGDYFADRYVRAGFVPWFDYRIGKFGYDPNFNYYRAHFAGHGTWERGLRELYQARFRGEVPRPPRTLVQQTRVIENLTVNNSRNEVIHRSINITNVQNVSVLAPLAQIHNTHVTNLAALANARATEAKLPVGPNPLLKLQAVQREQVVEHQKAAEQLRAIAQQRQEAHGRMLTEGAVPVHVTDRPRSSTLKLPAALPAPVPRPAPAVRLVPPAPTPPRHEERTIPKHEPVRPPAPPKASPPPRKG